MKSIKVSSDEQIELCKKAQRGDQKAAQLLTQANLGAIYKSAHRYVRGSTILEIEDLVASGCEGILEAIKRFEPERGIHFLTYAQWWIKAKMLAAVRSTATHLSGYDKAKRLVLSGKWRKAMREMEARGFTRHEAEETFAREHKLSPLVVRALSDLDRPPVSLESAHEDTGFELPGNDNAQDETVDRKRLAENVEDVLSKMRLSDKETRILRQRIMGQQKTLEELGDEMGISRERVRQIEHRLVEKLRKALRRVPLEAMP